MRIQNKKKSTKKKLIITTTVLTMAALILFGYFLLTADQGAEELRSSKVQNNKPSDQSSTNDSREISEKSDELVHEQEKDITPPYEGQNINASQNLSGVITYSGLAGDNLIIRTNINQSLGDGVCTLTMTSGSKVITKTSGIATNPSSSSCEGFDIPTSELSSGSWTISIAVNSAERSGTLSGQVSI